MLQRDYIVEMTRRFGEVLSKRLRAAMLDADPDAIHDLEDAVGNLLDLDGATALSLDPDSLVTMMELSGIADSLAEYVTYALLRIADAYEVRGSMGIATARRQQAEAICKSFMVKYDHVPEEYRELDAEIAAEKERA